MKTVEEHNKSRRVRYDNYDDRSGIQCPHCGDEMKYSEPSVMLLSYPPQKHVHCDSCKYKTTVIA